MPPAPQPNVFFPKVCQSFEAFCIDAAEAESDPTKRYVLVSTLGTGATATVILVRRLADEKLFALKVVELSCMSESDRCRASAELECLVNCDFFSVLKCHEDFVKYDTVTKEPAFIALVLDYANSGDLRKEIRNRAKSKALLKEHEAGLIFIQVLLAVHHVHTKHIIHRDIKSANILLSKTGLVRLADFGFSKIYDGSISDCVGGTFCGTPYYVAPEMWKRDLYSKKADIFSLGVLLYELLTLKRPYDGTTPYAVMAKILAGEYDPLPLTISPEMAAMVTNLLQANPSDRMNTVQLLQTDLCKMFISGLRETVVSGAENTEEINQQILASLTPKRRPPTDPASLLSPVSLDSRQSSSNVLGSVVVTSMEIDRSTVIFEGEVRKEAEGGVWKQRYLCLRSSPTHQLILGVHRDSLGKQCIVTELAVMEDVFAVPPKYTGPAGTKHVFALVFKGSGKRINFQAKDDYTRDEWMEHIQNSLGL